MATIDRVYQTVQDAINKEQRGYLTPEEFNNFAHLAQNEIFELYFHDYNFFENARKAGRTNTEYADLPKHFRERINMFSTTGNVMTPNDAGVYEVPDNLYRLTSVEYNGAYAEEEEFDQLRYSERTRLGRSSTARPVYTRLGNNIRMYPTTISDAITLNYIRKPNVPHWSYTMTNGEPFFNDNLSDFQDFEIHAGDEHELTNMILGYAGVTIREPDITTVAQNEATADINKQFRV